ncbi:MAG: hypothetical protein N3F07_04005 [Candidatus Micrarchaeota archaeon]|nr:hypothetical protein [Candidatus Micrarchaeota archaeon]
MAKAQESQKESGICILCGGEKKGYPAKVDLPIYLARKAREALRLPPRHSIACESCFSSCVKKRQEFEKKLRSYRLGAALFAALTIIGGAMFGRLELWLAVPSILGAGIILLLPYGSYFPSFQEKLKQR